MFHQEFKAFEPQYGEWVVSWFRDLAGDFSAPHNIAEPLLHEELSRRYCDSSKD